jgi:hypothetical protein
MTAPPAIPVRVLRRDADSQLRLSWLPTIGEHGGLELRLFRKSPAEEYDFDAFRPTSAGIVVGREQLRAFAGMVREILAEIEATP